MRRSGSRRCGLTPIRSSVRVWKSVKYEEVYLKAYANVPEGRASIGKHLDFYNGRRPHQSLARQTPDQAYFKALQPIPVAA
jgi:putative transposase